MPRVAGVSHRGNGSPGEQSIGEFEIRVIGDVEEINTESGPWPDPA